MHILKKSQQLIFVGCFFILSFSSLADPSKFDDLNTDNTIRQLYHKLHDKLTSDASTRAEIFSGVFLGKPYVLGALGEGTKGHYDQRPLYRVDGFDCETYVDTVLALTFANHLDQFKQCMNQIRYCDGRPSYLSRNHFVSLDWNQNNQHKQFIKDITTTFHNQLNQPVALEAMAIINKPAWYNRKTMTHLSLNGLSLEEKNKRLLSLKKAGQRLPALTSKIAYIPLSALFDASGNANMYLFNQIPHGAIIEIIRPNWDLTKEIGTHLHVSHLGLVFWKEKTLFFREASSKHQQVIEIPLIKYLRDALKSPTIKGINVQIILPYQNKACI